ncbi:MAG: hypothetical protein AAF721_05320 [Myxococcota bacterium]
MKLSAFDGVPFELDARCGVDDKAWAPTKPALEEAMRQTIGRRGFTIDGLEATTHAEDSQRRADAEAAVAAELGPPGHSLVPAELGDAVAQLTDPRATVELGGACGAGGAMPKAAHAMRQLVDAGDESALRGILRGLNAGGRIYGYVGLRILGRNTVADDAVFERLAALTVPLETCDGCSGNATPAAEVDLERLQRQLDRPSPR